jgi:hypothetical protein
VFQKRVRRAKGSSLTMVRGDACYIKASDNKAYQGQCDGTAEEAEALYNAVEADARRAAETGREP